MKTNDEIIKTLNDLRNREGISISELARRVDMAKSSVSRYFNGTREFPLNYVQAGEWGLCHIPSKGCESSC